MHFTFRESHINFYENRNILISSYDLNNLYDLIKSEINLYIIIH